MTYEQTYLLSLFEIITLYKCIFYKCGSFHKSEITQYSNSHDTDGLLTILMRSCYSAKPAKCTHNNSFLVQFPLQMCSPCTRSSTCGTLCFWETRLSLSASV